MGRYVTSKVMSGNRELQVRDRLMETGIHKEEARLEWIAGCLDRTRIGKGFRT